MLDALLRGDADTALTILDELYRGGKDVSALLGQLASLYRDILLGRVAPKNGGSLTSGGFSEGELARLSDRAGTETLLRGLDIVQAASAQLDKASDRRLAAELCLVRLAALGGMDVGNAFAPATAAMPENRPAPEVRAAAPAPQPISQPAPVSAKDAPLSIPELKQPEAPQKAPTGSVTWETILAKLEESLFIADYMLLSNPENLSGSLMGDTLTLCPKNDMVRDMLDSGRLEEIRTAAMALTGGSITVKLENASEKPENRFEKVDQLFGKFNFGN